MDIKTFCKRFMLWTAVIVAVVMLTLSQFFYHGSRWDPTSEKYKKLHGEKK